MYRIRCKTLLVVLAAGFVALPAVAGVKPSEDKLLATLASGVSAIEKNTACRELKLVGTEKSIPALAALLTDKALSHPARLALESMPYAAAGAALREAVGKTTGLTKSGVIDSLGERRDPAAVPVIAPALADPEQQVVAAAAWALGKIGTVKAAQALRSAQAKAQGDRRTKIGQGLVLCAANLLRAGKTGEAVAIYAELSAPSEPQTVRIGALAGMARSAGPKTVEVVRTLLANDDPLARDAGAGALPNLSAADLRSVALNLAKLSAKSQIAVVTAIRIRGDRTLLPVALEALESSDEAVCLAAIRALGTVGDESALPILVPLAAKDNAAGEAARRSIESLAGAGTDEKIFAVLRAEKDPQQRAAWIGIVQSRQAAGAVDVLLVEARHADPIVRRRAMVALGQLAAPKDAAGLIAGVLAAEKGPERDAAEKAVVPVFQQIQDSTKRVEPILAQIAPAAPADKAALLPLAGRFGSAKVLVIVQEDLQSSDPSLSEAALHALWNWPDASAADQLWQLAETSKTPSHRIASLRAYVRVVSLPGQASDAQRLAALKKAMTLAGRDEDRALVLERAGAVRSVESLRFVLPYLDQPALAETACKAVADLAHHRDLCEPNKVEFRPVLDKVLRTSKDRLTIERVKRYLDSM